MRILRGITIGQHYPLDSPVHRLDPRTKILAALLYMVALFVTTEIIGFVLLICFSLLAIRASRLPARLFWRGLRPVLWIVSFTLLIHTLITPGGSLLFSWWRISIYSGGIQRGLFLGARLLLMVTTTSLLTLTTSPITLTDGLERLLSVFKPLGLPAHEIALMMTIALRFIPILVEEAVRLAMAQTARGADFESGNLWQRMQNLLPLLVPLFISSIRRSDDLATAMEARCYRGGEGRSRYKELKPGRSDRLVLVGVVLLFAAVVLLNIAPLSHL